MNVVEALSRIGDMSDGQVLVAVPPLTWSSEAAFATLTDELALPEWAKVAGYQYLLGRDDLRSLLGFLEKKKASDRAQAEFVIHYAQYDAYPSWIDDIPDR